MYAVVRSYSGKGAKELFDIIDRNRADGEKLLRGVEGTTASRSRKERSLHFS